MVQARGGNLKDHRVLEMSVVVITPDNYDDDPENSPATSITGRTTLVGGRDCLAFTQDLDAMILN